MDRKFSAHIAQLSHFAPPAVVQNVLLHCAPEDIWDNSERREALAL